ncbi:MULTISPECIES: protealysin inhibitor emfourin [unclassified Frankia]|uniref:protealysin inhibitor emfourin n=1 Tax=unclassified Frankia TaxID=2632575 RepID=UPI001EF45B99|nr:MULTISPECIES: protealysin inhibitor emfourin [unclassified Frankia]
MRVELERSGGFAGLTLRAVLDTDQLPPDQARKTEVALNTIRWDDQPPSPKGADYYQYQLTVTDPTGRQRSTTLYEPQIPTTLRPLLHQLVARGQLSS